MENERRPTHSCGSINMAGENTGGATFRAALTIYDELSNRAKRLTYVEMLEFGYPVTQGEEYLVFFGNLSAVGASVGLASGSVYNALDLLRQMRCVDQLRKGTIKRESVFLLNYKPTVDQWTEFRNSIIRVDRKVNPDRYDVLLNHFRELKDMVIALTERIDHLEDNGDRLTRRVDRLEG